MQPPTTSKQPKIIVIIGRLWLASVLSVLFATEWVLLKKHLLASLSEKLINGVLLSFILYFQLWIGMKIRIWLTVLIRSTNSNIWNSGFYSQHKFVFNMQLINWMQLIHSIKLHQLTALWTTSCSKDCKPCRHKHKAINKIVLMLHNIHLGCRPTLIQILQLSTYFGKALTFFINQGILTSLVLKVNGLFFQEFK